MRSLSRGGVGHWPRGVLVATGLGLGAVGGFVGGLVQERRTTRHALSASSRQTGGAGRSGRRPGRVPRPRGPVGGSLALRVLIRVNGMRF
jgi:hypothetical protein